MITAIQRFLTRHRRWLFAALLVTVVVPFVFTIGASPGIVSGGHWRRQKFFDVAIRSPEDWDALRRETALGLYLDGIGGVSLDGAILARSAWDWLVRRLQVPPPGREILKGYVRSRPAFQEDGAFSLRRYGDFVHSLHPDPARSEALALGQLGQDWARNWTANTLACADFTLPAEARLQWLYLQTRWTLHPARLAFQDFHPPLELTEEAIREHFDAGGDRFHAPELLRLVHVSFPFAGEEGEDPSDADLAEFFWSHGELFPGADAAFLKERRDSVATAFRRWHSPAFARGNEFLYNLYSKDLAHNSPEIIAAAAALGGGVQELEPFPPARPPGTGPVPAEALLEAASLDEVHFFSNPILTGSGVHILLYQGRTPSVPLPFEEVRERVAQDLRNRERVRLFAQRARELRETMARRLAEGENFAALARELGLHPGEPSTFTLAELPESIPLQRVATFDRLERGELSEFSLVRPDLELFFVAEKQVPAVDAEALRRWERENERATGQLVLRQFIEEKIGAELD
ncbi:MAG: peptidyl-prolyl cis-trans isomerase [Puniceicoccales bacterium]|nr:peptidyl-prolyl cis-trans isomerase [Puniceicoccales bacterium]